MSIKRLSRAQSYQVYKKMEALQAHIFNDRPSGRKLAAELSEDLGFPVTCNVVYEYFKVIWPDQQWPRQVNVTKTSDLQQQLDICNKRIEELEQKLNNIYAQLGIGE